MKDNIYHIQCGIESIMLFLRQSIGEKPFMGRDRKRILRQLCEWKGVNVIEAEVCVDHIYMLLEIPPKISVLDS